MPEIQHEGRRLYYEVSGTGDPIVLTHSVLCAGDMWRHQVPALIEKGWRVINIDLPGHGQSEPPGRVLDIYELAAATCAVLDAEEIDKAVWCGLSIGGMLSLRAALTTPERVRALVVADSAACPDRWQTGVRYRAMAAWNRVFGLRGLVGPVTKIFLSEAARRTQPALVAELQAQWAAADRATVQGYILTLNHRDDLVARLGQIEVPALVLVGEFDATQPPARSQQIAQGILGASFQMVPAAGHLSALEQPEPFNRALLAFLADLT